MPRVKIDYVVSFSSEDPENRASNLLLWEVSKRRWLCSRDEAGAAASVVLQLARAVTISSVQIGAHMAALVEVLVARSESPTEPFQVLVPSSVFLSPRESRGGAGGAGGAGGPGGPAAPGRGARVRSFEGPALAEGTRSQRWDRVRIVCSQPYDKHCKFGISFIHIFEPEGAASPAPGPARTASPAVPPRMFALDTVSSDEDEFRPGELFAKHLLSARASDPGAQIRQATSLAIKNNPDAATKLMKTTLSKNKIPATTSCADRTELRDAQRDKDNLMYTKDDERPHAKIDHIVQRHKDERSKDEASAPKPKERAKDRDKVEKTSNPKREEASSSGHSESRRDRGEIRRGRGEVPRAQGKGENRKLSHDRNARSGSGSGSPAELPLRGVVFVLSGYEGQERAALRNLGLSLGARVERDWGPTCTHLICAFPNTPKLRAVRAVRAAEGGARVPCVRASWLHECARRAARVSPRAHLVHRAPRDTDEVLRQRAASPSPARAPLSPGAAAGRPDDDVEFVKDERMQGNITIEDSEAEGDTDAEEAAAGERIAADATLPALFEGLTFVLDAGLLAPLLARYCRAYGGLVLSPSEVNPESGSYYELCASLPKPGSASGSASGSAPGARRVRADWVWACHAARALLPLDDYVGLDDSN